MDLYKGIYTLVEINMDPPKPVLESGPWSEVNAQDP